MKKVLVVISILFLCALPACSAPALYTAAGTGDIVTVKALLDKGTDANEKGGGGLLNDSNALTVASLEGHYNVVKILLDRGANVNKTSGNMGWTALSGAAYKGHTDVVKLLISRGADINKAIFALNKGVGTADATELLKEYRREMAPAQPKSSNPSTVISSPASFAKSDVDDLPSAKIIQKKNSYAIVIGVENYRQKLPKADFAVSDAKKVSEYLEKVLGYPEKNVITLLNEQAAKSDFEKYFERWLGNNVDNDATVFVYFSGHGAPDPKNGGAYLVPYDGDPTFIAETGYSLKRMYDALGKLQAKEIVVALDSCFSGAGGRSVIAKGARPLVMSHQGSLALSKNMTVLSASSGEQISSTYDEKGHGLFTYFLLKGIKYEDVVKADGSIKMDDLFNYIKPQVERVARRQYNNEQTPQLIGARK